MSNYYYLAASLPPLVFGEVPEISFVELSGRLALNLTKKDFEKTQVLRRYIDLQNIRSLFLEEPIDPRGFLSEKELDEALLTRTGLPEYVFDFLDQYELLSDRIRYFSSLLVHYFAEEGPKQDGFLRKFLQFEREWRLVLIGLRAQEMGRDLSRELQFEDPKDPFVQDLLVQKDMDRYAPPMEYQEIKEMIAASGFDPWERYRAFAAFRFSKIEELVDTPLFSIDQILAYLAQLMILESMNELDKKRGKAILDATLVI